MIRVKDFSVPNAAEKNEAVDIDLLEEYRRLVQPLAAIEQQSQGASFALKRPLDDRISDVINYRFESRHKRRLTVDG